MNLSLRAGWTRSSGTSLSVGILAVNQIPDLRSVHVYINSATSRLSAWQKRSRSRSLLFRWIPASDTLSSTKEEHHAFLFPFTPYRIHFRLLRLHQPSFPRFFRAADTSADLQPIRYFAWKMDIRVSLDTRYSNLKIFKSSPRPLLPFRFMSLETEILCGERREAHRNGIAFLLY